MGHPFPTTCSGPGWRERIQFPLGGHDPSIWLVVLVLSHQRCGWAWTPWPGPPEDPSFHGPDWQLCVDICPAAWFPERMPPRMHLDVSCKASLQPRCQPLESTFSAAAILPNSWNKMNTVMELTRGGVWLWTLGSHYEHICHSQKFPFALLEFLHHHFPIHRQALICILSI